MSRPPFAALAFTGMVLSSMSVEAREPRDGPSLTLGMAVEKDQVFFHSWIGISHFEPRRGAGDLPLGTIADFASAGLEVDARSCDTPAGRGTLVDIRPTVRVGVASVVARRYVMVPRIAVYGLAGFHPKSEWRPTSVRLGAGLSVPALLPVFLHLAIPTMVELTCDLSEEDSVVGVRFGWAL